MKLTVLKNQIPISHFELKERLEDGLEVYVGRSEDCHVRLNDPLISRHLFVFIFNNGNWEIKKLTANTILFLNNAEFESTLLKNGDQISFSGYTLIFTGISTSEVKVENAINFPQTLIDMNITSNKAQELNATEVIPMPQTAQREEFKDEMNDFQMEIEPAPVDNNESSLLKEEEPGEIESENLDHDFDDNLDSQNDEFNNSSLNGANSLPEESSSNNFEAPVENSMQMNESSGDLINNSESTKIFQSFAKSELIIFGEFAPYDRYLIESGEVFIGRDAKKCQIILNDPEVSSVHAVIRKSGGQISLEDLRSANGTLLKGQRVNKVDLRSNDEFVIGSTSFTLKISSDIMEQENSRLMPVDLNQVIEKEEIIEEEVEVPQDSISGNYQQDSVEEKSLLKRIWKDPVKRKRLIMYGGVAALVLLLLPSEPEAPKAPPVEKVADSTKKADPNGKDPSKKEEEKNIKKLTDEEIRNLEAKYRFAESMVAEGKLDDAMAELEQIMAVDDTFGNVKTLYAHIKQKNENIKKEQEEKAELERREKVKEEIKQLVAEAEKAVKEKNFKLAREYFAQISQKDPENIKVRTLEIEIQGYEEEENRKRSEEDKLVSKRKRMVDSLTPGKKSFLKKEWHVAILELEKFLLQKEMDEDLVKEASEMMGQSKENLNAEVAPILGKARSLNEGQDLKAAFEAYQEVLRIDPTNAEAVAESDQIRDSLDNRAKKSYREAIIYESLSLFTDAKEKFLEVQQNSPLDSEYYKKANDKLKNYLE